VVFSTLKTKSLLQTILTRVRLSDTLHISISKIYLILKMKAIVRIYFTLFSIVLATILLSVISSEHKEAVFLFRHHTDT